ncbi:DNA primase [Streptomyces sp. NPDC021622]|uniref:DNA primase n=1 Tax=Streptomyces sp. NPDC021622 TaxID=3155013 RepID=UPI0033DF7E3D
MNRQGLGLALGAGYVLGRTKKMKLALAVGTMVAAKRMRLGPRVLGDLVSRQLQENPQFKEIGDQLRADLQGVGRAASGALVERQMEGLADRLHGRTEQLRDRIAGVAPDVPGATDEAEDEPAEEEPAEEVASERKPKSRPRKKTAAPKAAAKKSAPQKGPARKTAAKKAPGRKTAAKKAARRGTGADRPPKRGAHDD